MNILYDNIIFSLQNSGGVSVFWSELTKRLLKTGNKIYFLEYKNAKNNQFRANLKIPTELLCIKTTNLLNLKRYLSPKIAITGNTIFHSSYYRIIRHPKVANVTSIHDFVYEYHRRGLVKYVHFFQKRFAIKNSDLIICVSENTKKDLKKFFPGIPNDKIVVVYNGISEYFFKLTDFKDYAHLPFLPHSFLMYVGDRRAKYKNFENLIKCFPNNVSFLIAGGGQPTQREIKLLTKYLQPGQFKFTGFISNSALNIFYNHAKALIYPSSYEGFGIPIAEAQKAGCPVIALNTSSIPEVAGAGALLIPALTNEALNTALLTLDNPKNRENIISLGLKNAERYSWDTSFAKTNEAYQAVWAKKFSR